MLKLLHCCCCCCCKVASVMSDSVRPHRRQPTRLLYPWDSPGKNKNIYKCQEKFCKHKAESEWNSNIFVNSAQLLLIKNICIISRYVYLSPVIYLSFQSCPVLCDPMNYSLPSSSVHGILQARILEWVARPSSRGSSQPRDQTGVS